MTLENPEKITLQPNACLAHLNGAIADALHVMGVALPALTAAPAAHHPAIEGALVNFRLELNGLTDDQHRARHQTWLLQSGFHSLARGLRFTMEAAYVYCRIVHEAGPPVLAPRFFARIKELELEAERLRNDGLARALNRDLSEPLELGRQLQSLIQVRNCLEHRGGIVGRADVGDSDELELSLPFFKIFGLIDGVEVELVPGFRNERALDVNVRRDERQRIFRLGEQVQFSPADFAEIAQGSWLLGQEIVSKLPVILPPADAA